ncbi:LysR family transcriptional regulator [Rhodoferax mekongensis]|uniref:LysR family transcriptional regulator n=1 Tax=Rhodoferax mekongensis TaxID=3068341 RepID=A0ABZ0B368_9BURK|nr:LysR family transcriptional regulator [Rhodoferax sp. TBRC 17307]WNO06351.1 LysR family transcriptional regulator [Rhodoferax sp. TBRC 17307]
MQDTNDMLYFAEVVERGGFAAAGRHLGIPKSKLSRRVAELETRLGVRLLQRTTRKLSVTEVGEVYLRHCIAMRDAAEAAAEAVEQVQTEPRGTIRIACPVTLAQSTVGPIMALFLARHPLVKVDMRISNRVVDLVEEGVDVALRVRPSLDDSGSLVVKKLGESNTVLVASPLQLARQGQPVSIDDLARMDTISMSAVDGRASLVLQGRAGATHTLVHQPRYVADDLLTLKFAALQGTGMCFLPDYMCQREIEQGRLVHVLPGWAPPRGIFHAVYPSRRGMVPAVRRFLDFLGEHTSNEGMPVLPEGCPSIG